MHTALKFMEVIGKHVQSSGLQLEAWVEGNLLGPKTAEKVMAEKSHYKGMRAHKITVQAMWRILLPQLLYFYRNRWFFYVRQLYRQCWERVLAMGILSVRLSVCPGATTRYRIKPRWDRDSGFSPYGSLGSVVSNKIIWCRWVKRFPSNEGIKEGYPLKNCYFSTIGSHVAWKRLQIDTGLLLLITSTADELSTGTNIDDLERPWTPKIGGFGEFLAILGCHTHFMSELRRNHSR